MTQKIVNLTMIAAVCAVAAMASAQLYKTYRMSISTSILLEDAIGETLPGAVESVLIQNHDTSTALNIQTETDATSADAYIPGGGFHRFYGNRVSLRKIRMFAETAVVTSIFVRATE